jgi:AcrR family transcriptional regulator
MAPEDRRAAIVEAIVPLVCARGWSVTTKEIAAAAGVADGTIFSVFKDKEELLLAALQAALDPEPVVERLSHIDLSLPLEERMVQVVDILQELAARIGQLSPTLQLDEVRGRLPRHYSGDSFAREVLAPIFEPSRHELRLEPAVAGQALFALTSGSNPLFYRRPLKTSEIVTLMLDGVRLPASAAPAKGRRSRKSDVA